MIEEPVVLIVDDEKHTRDGLRMSLEDEFDVYVAANIGEAMEVLKAEAVDVMVTDLRLGSEDGMDLVEQALALPAAPICIMMTAYGSVDTAVEAMKRGAYHFVTKPLNIDELEILIKRALRSREVEDENRSLKKQVEKQYAASNILGRSGAIEHVLETVEQVAPTKTTVLIEGESGTGKELVAHAIHNLSGRPKSKLVIVHCAALSAQLLESELFGHERGAFTGATEKRIGRFEQANGGTLFLDEIGEIDMGTQVKLLRALGERTIERVGGNESVSVDVRVVAATNKNLEDLVAAGEFREDLYYRLNVVKVVMPPLRERREDIVLLAQAFLKEFAEENGKPFRELSAEAMQALVRYDWPGNVRELRTAIEHGVVMSKGPKITLRHLPEAVRTGEGSGGLRASGGGRSAGGSSLNLESAEQDIIERALERTSGNRTEAAKLLGISRRTLQRKLKAFQEENSD
ncbi:MAG: sigma-54 dependent transcriptional regulator [Verrucomicrobiota bacterium]